ncbi:MAG TPA: hypothetical protein VFF58_00555 [Candidatus Nitrosotalea sp.]|nr:hypothetical protein [Candidatus Nitrosotalea sp.]
MAHSTLAVLSSPDFPQAFAAALDRELAQIERLVLRAEARVHLTRCFWEDQHCDCRELATVHHLASEQEFCLRHFQEVSR